MADYTISHLLVMPFCYYLRLKTQEIRISSRLALRNILNADQKVLFDARTVGNGNNRGSRGNKTGMNNHRGNRSNRF